MLGWDNLFHCEINPFGRKILEYWFPNSKSYEDITQTDFSEWRGRINVLSGGFPCQPFSYAGRRRGASDDRYLWPFMFKCIDQVQPDWVVCENVAGILTMVEQGQVSKMASQASLFNQIDGVSRYKLRETFTLQRICDDLEQHGYEVQPVLIPACGVGAPHLRNRVFIIGHRNAEDSMHSRQLHGQDEKQGSERYIGAAGPGDSQRLRGETSEFAAADTSLQRGKRFKSQLSEAGREEQGKLRENSSKVSSKQPFADSYCKRGRKIYEHLQPQQPNGAESFGYGGQRFATDTKCERLFQSEQIGQSRSEKGLFARCGCGTLREWCTGAEPYEIGGGGRWQNFPTVSPIHRGNDGFPFNVDDLSISFNKWRSESLKAYGNAIVPQVMYEIFRVIDQIDKEK